MNRSLLPIAASGLAVLLGWGGTGRCLADERLAAAIAGIPPHVAADSDRQQLSSMLNRFVREKIAAANQASSADWATINSRQDWTQFRERTLAALKSSLRLPPRTKPPASLITGRFQGDGYAIQNVVFESRPGLVVTANLYVPDPPRERMPGLLLSHSHHNPKHEGELQDMGMTWARAGCYVLVPDQLGHGERRQHPFVTAADYEGSFQLGRQDYYFRYDTSLQLYLAGESLMGWLVHDLLIGVDFLLGQPGIDPQRIIVLGSVAGGGDPAAVAAAVDERIACCVPFNFGGPQPESRYPLPAGSATSFNYAGSGSWESTRNLYRSAADGFLPWAIVGSLAPRRLIHAHEFSWDRERDPVWQRYEKIWGFYEAQDHLAFAHGHGTLTGQDPPGSHCNNIGAVHRRQIHEVFRQWFGIDVKPEAEFQARRPREELICLTDAARQQFQPQPLWQILQDSTAAHLKTSRAALEKVPLPERRKLVRASWTRLLANVEPPRDAKVRPGSPAAETIGELLVRRELLDVEPGITVPVMVLSRQQENAAVKSPLVVCVAADGIGGVLRRRANLLGDWLGEGKSVAIVEVRGAGSTSPGDDHGQQGAITAHAATQLMLGDPLVAGQLRDLRAAWRHLAAKGEFDPARMSVVGDSPIAPLPAEAAFSYPRRISGRPPECLPQGALWALLLALFEDDVATVECSGGLASFQAVLAGPFVQVPLECVVPGMLHETDLPDLVAALAPRPVTTRALVDGCGRTVSTAAADQFKSDN